MRIFIWCFSCLLAATVSGAELHFNFAGYSDSAALTNFHAALIGGGGAPSWKIIGAEVPSAFQALPGQAPLFHRSSVLAQTSEDMTDERFPMFIYDGATFDNFKFTTRFAIISGVAEQMAGVVFRFQNSSNFYVARVSVLGKNIRFYKVVNGVRSDPIGPAIEMVAGTWHTLAVQCDGNKILISLDDKLAMPALGDNTFADGKIGFWTKSDAVSYFSEATISYTPRVPAAQQMITDLLQQQPRILGLRIYTQTGTNATQILASKDISEVGQAGTDAELQAILNGTIFFGRDSGAVVVTLPLHDRNGEYIAAVRVKLKSFFGETQDTAVTRAMIIQKKLEQVCTSAESLQK
ncbi:MAG TPA: hypothetical protein VGO57_17030 [Verrucomicrobiae bacterium]